jgi:hypothetical protein
MSPAFESLVARFDLIQKRYEEAQTHDEKVQLAKIAKEIAREARKQIAEYKERLNFPTRGAESKA